jgi:hypothetical protein
MTLKDRFREASKLLPVHNENKNESIYYHGFKMERHKESGDVTIYKLYNNHHVVKKDSEMFQWFLKLPFKYVCDMLLVKRNFQKLYALDRVFVLSDEPRNQYSVVRSEAIDRIKTCLALITT